MIAHNSINLNGAESDDSAEDSFWGLNAIIEEYHHNVRRNAIRSGSHLAPISIGLKAQTVGMEQNRASRQQGWHTDVHQS